MNRDADTFISNNDRAFILKALQEECRLDGRKPFDFRKINFQFSLDDSSATVILGGTTRVMAVISAALEAPFPDRPSEGSIRFNVEAGPMASPAFEPGRPGPAAIELARLVERALKGSGAVDTEALCVMAGRKVWALRVDVHVLDHGGNLVDACVLAALAACMAFRRPEVSVGGESGTELIVHPPEQREPLPLTIHHLPVSITYTLYEDGNTVLVDPSLKEEAARAGSATIMVNTNKEVCAVHKADGVGLTSTQVMRLVRVACTKCEDIIAELKAALQEHEVARVQARVRRARNLVGVPQPSRHVSVSDAPGAVEAAVSKVKAAGTSNAAVVDKLAADMGIEVPPEPSSSGSEEEDESGSEGAGSSGSEGEDEEMQEAGAAGKGGRRNGKAGPASAKAAGAGVQDAKAGAAPGPILKDIKVKVDVGKGGAVATEKGRSPLQSPTARTGPSAGGVKEDGRKQQVDGKASPAKGAAAGAGAGLAGSKRKGASLDADDNLEAIAAVIAGAAAKSKQGPTQGEEDVADLAAAIKHDKVKKAAGGKKKKAGDR